MRRVREYKSIKLSGFNNLTKALSFNLYDFCIARNEDERRSYVEYIRNRYSAQKISDLLRGICDIIEANVLAISDQDYDPWGASSMILMSDLKGSGVQAHLDKSHICAHTYPDISHGGKVCSFRIDIDIATCGEISPLSALNYMFENLDNDVVVIDYVVRGYTRDENGKRIYMDHDVPSIQNYIDRKILRDYYCIDLALQSEHIWQTKMLRMRQDIPSYFPTPVDVKDPEIKALMREVNDEMRAVLHQWPS